MKDDGTNTAGFEIIVQNDGTLRATCAFDDVWGNRVSLGTIDADKDDGKWHHMVIVFDRSNYTYFIVDKHMYHRIDISSHTAKSIWKFPMHIGAERIDITHGVGRTPFDGEVDDFKIYNRALTFYKADGTIHTSAGAIVSGEVVRNYNAGKRSHR